MQFNTPGTLHCGKLSLNCDRLPTGTRRSWRSSFNTSNVPGSCCLLKKCDLQFKSDGMHLWSLASWQCGYNIRNWHMLIHISAISVSFKKVPHNHNSILSGLKETCVSATNAINRLNGRHSGIIVLMLPRLLPIRWQDHTVSNLSNRTTIIYQHPGRIEAVGLILQQSWSGHLKLARIIPYTSLHNQTPEQTEQIIKSYNNHISTSWYDWTALLQQSWSGHLKLARTIPYTSLHNQTPEQTEQIIKSYNRHAKTKIQFDSKSGGETPNLLGVGISPLSKLYKQIPINRANIS